MSYDSRLDTMEHILKVRRNLQNVVGDLGLRMLAHDKSKLEDPEKALFDEWSPKLKELTYGSDEYKTALAAMGPALQHHYEVNRHHPEHWPGGINDMSLLDIIEMLADWQAATERVKDGDLAKSIKINCQRFGIDPQIGLILANTAKDLGWIEHR